MSVVTLVGDRQSGKTEMLVALTDWLIRAGQRVLYVGNYMPSVKESMRRLELSIDGDSDYVICRRNGQESVSHKSGGLVIFASVLSKRGRGFNCDSLILDEVPCYVHASPDAKFVYHAPFAAECPLP